MRASRTEPVRRTLEKLGVARAPPSTVKAFSQIGPVIPASTTRVCRPEHRVRLYYDWVVTVATIARHRFVPVSWSALDRS